MCGIAGMLRMRNARPIDDGVIKRATDVLAHRGPDAEGVWADDAISLGHRRLSIIDLSDRARQPMASGDNRYVIVFNGEIYNFRELSRLLEEKGYKCRTRSDTEVILGLYEHFGTSCLQHLRGMFAFAIWDQVTRRLFLARDRVGIKPLYYYSGDDYFVFASEIKAVVATGVSQRKLNIDALGQFMRFLVVPQPSTAFCDIRKLEPGHFMVVGADGSVTRGSYWALINELQSSYSENEDDSIQILERMLVESVGYHMVADVPVGAFLSGGLDSSAIVALMRQHSPSTPISTYSTTFPEVGGYDEDEYARAVSKQLRTQHHAEAFRNRLFEDIDQVAWYLDEPFAIGSAFALFRLAESAAGSTKVVLTGDGGDELFAGYEGYKNDAYIRHPWVGKVLTGVYHAALSVENALGTRNPVMLQLLTGLARRCGSEGLRYSEQVAQSSLYAMSTVLNEEVFITALKSWQGNLLARHYDSIGDGDKLRRKLYAEYMTRLVDEMLMKVDRMTMAHGLEARVPLLDHKVVETAFRIPSCLKLRDIGGEKIGKYILKRTMEPLLSKDIIYRQKQGFNVPIREWMRGGVLEQVGARIMGGVLRRHGVLNGRGVERIIGEHASGRRDHHNMLLLLYSHESWAESYEKSFGSLLVS